MKFCTSIHCMDGRIQEPIIRYLKKNQNIAFIDTITEPGPCKILAENTDKTLIDTIYAKVDISITKHNSKLIAISGHHDCAGNPTDEKTQKKQIKQSMQHLTKRFTDIPIIGLWVDITWQVHPL